MKYLIILTLLILGSCAVDRNTLTLHEAQDWSSNHDTIFYRHQPIAVFTSIELELYDGKITRELCLVQINDTISDESSLIKYIHNRHPHDKVQLKTMYPRD